jgi:hypothetical protein
MYKLCCLYGLALTGSRIIVKVDGDIIYRTEAAGARAQFPGTWFVPQAILQNMHLSKGWHSIEVVQVDDDSFRHEVITERVYANINMIADDDDGILCTDCPRAIWYPDWTNYQCLTPVVPPPSGSLSLDGWDTPSYNCREFLSAVLNKGYLGSNRESFFSGTGINAGDRVTLGLKFENIDDGLHGEFGLYDMVDTTVGADGKWSMSLMDVIRDGLRYANDEVYQMSLDSGIGSLDPNWLYQEITQNWSATYSSSINDILRTVRNFITGLSTGDINTYCREATRYVCAFLNGNASIVGPILAYVGNAVAAIIGDTPKFRVCLVVREYKGSTDQLISSTEKCFELVFSRGTC